MPFYGRHVCRPYSASQISQPGRHVCRPYSASQISQPGRHVCRTYSGSPALLPMEQIEERVLRYQP